MIKNSVIQILKSFSDKELRMFGEFIQTTFHNKNTKVIRFFEVLKKFHPGYSGENLSKENLFRELSGNMKFKESYIRNLFSDLNILAEKFLMYNLVSKNYKCEKLFIEDLKDRDLLELAEKKVKSFEKRINLNKVKDHGYYEDQNFIYEIKSFLIVDKTLTDSFRKEQMQNTMKLFMITLMESSFYLIVEEQRVKIKHSFDFLKHILEYIKNNLSDFEDSPLLMIYFYICMCFVYGNDERYFLKAKEYFKKNFSLLTKIDKKNIYSVMQVYYLNKIDSGDASYNKEFLDFLLEMLKFNVLSHKEKDFININLYRNILILCARLNETSILKKFISKYINFVDTKSRETILAYSNSHLNFIIGNFEKALELCHEIDFSDLLITTNENLFFKNDIKTLTLKCLYELNSLESAMSYIDAYKHFLNNSRLIKEIQRKRFLNFLTCLNEMVKLKISFDEFNFLKLKKKLLNKKETIHSDWLLKKINDIEVENFKK
jgi:hypothetical protein